MAVLKWFWPDLEKNDLAVSSDGNQIKQTIHIGVDSWVGYYPLCSKAFKRGMRGHGYLIKCEDDEADVERRFDQLKSGKLQFAVSTVDSYLKSGGKTKFPGTIITVIDQSKGGDGIVAYESKAKNLNELKTRDGLRIAYTKNSPSEFLLRAALVHFDIKSLLTTPKRSRDDQAHESQAPRVTHVTTDSAEEALKLFADKKVDMTVLWQPELTAASKLQGVVPLLSSKDTKNLIVDVLLAERGFADKNPELVRIFLGQYFRALKHYRDAPRELEEELSKAMKLDASDVASMLSGVRWFSLYENVTEWFGVQLPNIVSREDMIDVIESVIDILTSSHGITEHPLPRENPYFILNRRFVEDLYTKGRGLFDDQSAQKSAQGFEVLPAERWQQLVEVGTLKVRPIQFRSGTGELDGQSAGELSAASKNLAHYPNFRVIIEGHTATSGDEKANQELSLARAQVVKNYLEANLKIQGSRMWAVGKGSSEPLPRNPGESQRSYKYRLPRVELHLVTEPF